MFIKHNKDYIYVVTPVTINKEEESKLYSDNFIKVTCLKTTDNKNVLYYRISLLKKLSVKLLPKTLHITIPSSRLKHKVLLNQTLDDVILVQYSFKNTSYITFGKTCTEENI